MDASQTSQLLERGVIWIWTSVGAWRSLEWNKAAPIRRPPCKHHRRGLRHQARSIATSAMVDGHSFAGKLHPGYLEGLANQDARN
jgi:hypothetical protein